MKITSKGQVTIPHRLRQDFGLLPHTEVVFEAGEDGVILRSRLSRRALIRERLWRARGAGTGGRTTDEIMRLTRGED
jgi:AbrB family looped-hinge helix DNA binding protein